MRTESPSGPACSSRPPIGWIANARHRAHRLAAGCAPAAEGGWRGQLEQTSRAYRALAEHVDPAVVQIVTSGYAPASDNTPSLLRARRGTGAGVFVDPAGYILTNAHVVGEVRRVQVLVPRTGNGAALKPTGKMLPAR